MRSFFKDADHLTTEIGTVINLCEWIDQQHDADLSSTLPQMHALMRKHLDALVGTLRLWRAGEPLGSHKGGKARWCLMRKPTRGGR